MCKLPLRLEVCGYTNEVHLRGLRLYSRDFQRPVFSQNWDAPLFL